MPNTPTPGRPRAPRVLNTAALSIYQTTADTAPARRALLRQFLHEHELTPTALARQIGLSTANSFYNFLHGRSNALSQPVLELIARHFPDLQVTPQPGDASPAPTTCPVIAIASTGLEQRAFRLQQQLHAPLSIPVALAVRHADLFVVQVEGDGAERFYPPGSFLVCGGVSPVTIPTSSRRHLVVSRRWGNGVEVSIREQRAHGGQIWFWSGSNDPDHQKPLTLEEVTVEGIVLASWQPEPGYTLT
jgi:hypothetical protein